MTYSACVPIDLNAKSRYRGVKIEYQTKQIEHLKMGRYIREFLNHYGNSREKRQMQL